jgi:nucleotide-binding universal stress UspA family protein
LRTGHTAAEIIAAAENLGADLIVTGSRGLHGFDRLLLGSVARNVVHHASASVLVVRPAPADSDRDSPAAR